MMLDPANDLLAPPSSPTNSSISSSDLDTESTGSFFHDRSTTLGTLMGVTFPTITFRAQSQRRQSNVPPPAARGVVDGGNVACRRRRKAAALVAERRRRRWWRLCRDDESRQRSSLGEFLEVERRFGEVAFVGDAAVGFEGVGAEAPEGRLLFADGRVLPPAKIEEPSTAGAQWRFPVSLTGICSSGAG